jgi:hypothetical protein
VSSNTSTGHLEDLRKNNGNRCELHGDYYEYLAFAAGQIGRKYSENGNT